MGGGASELELTDTPSQSFYNNLSEFLQQWVDENDPVANFNEILVAGGSALSIYPWALVVPNCCGDTAIMQNANSLSHNVFNYSTGVIIGSPGAVLQSIIVGQGGGQATDIIDHNAVDHDYNNTFSVGGDSVYINKLGGSGGCGFSGGGGWYVKYYIS